VTPERPPHESHAAILATFVGGLAGIGVLARALGREPREQTALDLVALAAATFKAARTLSHDQVTSFLRDPFVKGHAHEGAEEPVDTGLRRAVGELVTCTRCAGAWAAAGLTGTQVLAPRSGRLLTWTLAAAAANDFLQAAFVALTGKADRLDSQAG
jgi:hypothetical protein